MKKIIFVLVSICITGCGSTYKPPVSGSTAKLEIPRPYSKWGMGLTAFGVGVAPHEHYMQSGHPLDGGDCRIAAACLINVITLQLCRPARNCIFHDLLLVSPNNFS